METKCLSIADVFLFFQILTQFWNSSCERNLVSFKTNSNMGADDPHGNGEKHDIVDPWCPIKM